MAEGVKQYGYMLMESVNGVKLAAKAYKRGHAILDTTARKLSGTPADALEASRIGLDPDSITGKLFNAGATMLDGVSARALEASDEFFKQTIYSSEVMSRAFTDGVNLRLKGDALKAYVKQQCDAAFMEMPDRGSRVANTWEPRMRNAMKGIIDDGGEELKPLFVEAMHDYFKGPKSDGRRVTVNPKEQAPEGAPPSFADGGGDAC